MHANEVKTDVNLVHQLLVDQFPVWADLSIRPVPSAGTDNALYRLGDQMVVRLPRIDWAADMITKEVRWLPHLAPHLPLPIPQPLAFGEPGRGYPWNWSVFQWLEGQNAFRQPPADLAHTARLLAEFAVALRRIDPTGGPPAGSHNVSRGVPLAARHQQNLKAIADLDGMIDTEAARIAWQAALDARPWSGQPVWIHGDLQPGNFLVDRGRLSAVIDFGCLGVGDPACDLMPAWNFLPAAVRQAYRQDVNVDEDTWVRGRGWALSVALIALPYYRETNLALAEISRSTIYAVLSEP